jgi:hypothetical protein
VTQPNWQALGTSASGTSGAVTPTIPTHAIGDLLVLAAEGDNTDFGTDPTGWTRRSLVVGNGNKLCVWTRIATSTTENTDHPTTITPTTANHTYAQVATARNVNQTIPIHVIAEASSGGATTAPCIPGFQTQVDACLYLGFLAWGADNAGPLASGEANSAVGTLTEQDDAGAISGNGGGLVIYSGTLASAGVVPQTTLTLGSSQWCAVGIALNPIADKTISGTVTINGSAAANGQDVRVLDLTQPAASYLCVAGTTGGGTGAFTCNAPYTTHNYQAVYEDGASYGASAVDVAV